MKKNKMGRYSEDKHSDYEESIDLESGEYIEEEPKPKRTYPTVYAIFREITGKDNPLNWKVNKTQQTAAENLLKEHTENEIRAALTFVKNYKDQEYCPTVDSPYDLDSKWAKIKKFKDSL